MYKDNLNPSILGTELHFGLRAAVIENPDVVHEDPEVDQASNFRARRGCLFGDTA